MGVVAKNRGKVAGTSLLLFVISVGLSVYSGHHKWTLTIGTTATSFFLLPFQRGADTASSSVSALWRSYVGLVNVQKENESLRGRLSALEAQNSKLLELESENGRLRKLVGYQEETGTSGISARVVGHNPSNWRELVTVTAGSERGVFVGMPVLSGNGLVGEVIATGFGSSQVLLITDHQSGVDAILQESRTRGTIQGQGDTLSLEYVVGDAEVKIGERVLTSGMDGVYPKGLLIGVVTQVVPARGAGKMFQSVIVSPTVEFSRLEEVLLITPPRVHSEKAN